MRLLADIWYQLRSTTVAHVVGFDHCIKQQEVGLGTQLPCVLIASVSVITNLAKVAHGILFETIRQLEDQGTHVPQSLRRSFVLLHSYILVRGFIFLLRTCSVATDKGHLKTLRRCLLPASKLAIAHEKIKKGERATPKASRKPRAYVRSSPPKVQRYPSSSAAENTVRTQQT